MTLKYLYLVAAAAVVGCASTAGQGASPRRGTLLTGEEIANAHADINTAYDAVARLRPNWLAAHGVTTTTTSGAGSEFALVFVDGQRYGDLNSLRSIPAYHVGDIRYYDVTQAGAKFGLQGGGSGVIEVTMKGPSRRTAS
ncbi:MAG: hypothetical protein ACJ8AJ_00900 [Gemmatimonadaceae bacterium]